LGHRYPLWVDHFPWGFLKSLRTVSMALPHITIPSSVLDPRIHRNTRRSSTGEMCP
jgi:hypothetical protein